MRNTRFDLTGDALSDELGIQFRTLDLENVDLHLLPCQFLQFFAKLVHFLAAFADDDTGAGRLHCNRDQLERALNDDVGNACLAQTGQQVLTDLLIFYKLVLVVVASVPI